MSAGRLRFSTAYLQQAHPEDSTQRNLLSLMNLQVPNENNRQCAQEEVLKGTDDNHRHNLSALVMTMELVLQPPRNVEIMPIAFDR